MPPATPRPAPMSVLEAIRRRRAVRSYLPDRISRTRISALLTAATWAPSAMHTEPWAFVVVQDAQLLRTLSERAKTLLKTRGKQWAETYDEETFRRFTSPEFNIFHDASTLIIICARPLGSLVQADCWLAAENLMLAACAYGLGTCVIGLAVQMLQDPQVKAQLGIPKDVTAIAPIILGRPRGRTPRTKRKQPLVFAHA